MLKYILFGNCYKDYFNGGDVMSRLFDSYALKGKTIKNRVVLPPMVCFGWTDDLGFVSERHIKHYEATAESGTGLITVEATCVNKDGRLSNTQLGIWSDEHIEGLSRIAAACRKHGAVVLIQIHHAGFMTPKTVIEPSQLLRICIRRSIMPER
jgi:2,4-dienoyl-CoA reductase-like NADH-dependent reductase (Old Yellow Enzyme family)